MSTDIQTSVIVNPFNQNMLSANVNITAVLPMRFSYRVQGKTPDSAFTYENDEYTLNPVIPVIGLYANAENTIIIECFFRMAAMKHSALSLTPLARIMVTHH